MNPKVPHFNTIVAFCILAVVGYGVLSGWVVLFSDDLTTRGNVIATWQNFAVAAFSFWIGSSSGGKSTPSEPVETRVVNPPDDPVNTTESHTP